MCGGAGGGDGGSGGGGSGDGDGGGSDGIGGEPGARLHAVPVQTAMSSYWHPVPQHGPLSSSMVHSRPVTPGEPRIWRAQMSRAPNQSVATVASLPWPFSAVLTLQAPRWVVSESHSTVGLVSKQHRTTMCFDVFVHHVSPAGPSPEPDPSVVSSPVTMSVCVASTHAGISIRPFLPGQPS